MASSPWFRWWRDKLDASNRPPANKRRSLRVPPPPRLEYLEERLTPTTWLVNTITDTASGFGNSGALRYALTDATSGDTITFQSGLGAIVLSSSLPALSTNLTIVGQSPGNTVISGGNMVQVFLVGPGVTANISNLTVENGNTTACGGGIENQGTLILSDLVISGNAAAGPTGGGGIYNSGSLSLTNSTITGNSANYGGGISNTGTVTVSNSTVFGNSAQTGGGITALAGIITLTNDTVSGNSAVFQAGGIHIANAATINLYNTIVADNTASTQFPDASGTVAVADNDLIGQTLGVTISGGAGNVLNPPYLGLSAPGNYGGSTQTIALLPGSPAIDSGDNGLVPAGIDQRGQPRIVNGTVDIGSFESQGFTLGVVSGNNQSDDVNTTFSSLVVSVTANNPAEPVNGGQVRFAVTSTGIAGATPATLAATIASGQVSDAPTANAFVGSYTETASSSDASSVSFDLTNTPAVTANMNLLAGTATIVTIAGSGFDTSPANDSVAFNNGVTGNVIGATSTSLTAIVSGLSSLAEGTALTVYVTIDGVNSGASVQVATLGPVITTTTLPNWTVGQPYSQIVAVTGGTSPFNFVLTSGSLPAGLSLISGTGAITGTPTTATGSSNAFTISATDATGVTASQAYSITINSALTITTTTLPSSEVGANYSQTIAVAGGTSPDTFAVAVGNLPAGLSLNATTGMITGVPTATNPPSPTINDLYSFPAGGVDDATGLVADSNGDLFGVTQQGGRANDGTVFEISASTQTVTTLVEFNGTVNGSDPDANLIVDSNGNLFGTTFLGGASNYGTVFEVLAGTAELNTLLSFNGSNGAYPMAALTEDSNGNLFGTTTDGTLGYGTVFELSAGTYAYTKLVTFTSTNGADPLSPLYLDGSNNLYGTTKGGGTTNSGTIFEIAAGTHSFSTLVSFTGSANGSGPRGSLVMNSSGNLFGAATGGGLYSGGAVFELNTSTDSLSSLVSLYFTNGQAPMGGLAEDSSGNLYGTTTADGSYSYGTVFEIPAENQTLTVLANFNGASSQSNLVVNSAGDLFGTTNNSGTAGDGSAFEIVAGSHAFSSYASFLAQPDGLHPANLIIDGNGNIYGTADGGAYGDGLIFEIPAGAQTPITLATFSGSTGLSTGGLVMDSQGNLYGTTDGNNGDGSIFKIAAGTHNYTTLINFDTPSGSAVTMPSCGLVVDSSGDLFGESAGNSTTNVGTVFEFVASTATVSILAFPGFPTNGGLVEDSNGNLYGETDNAGIYRDGSIYEITAGTHAFSTLASFNLTDGYEPTGGLLLDGSGNLFGVTLAGSTGDAGSVFEVAAGTNAITTLNAFSFSGTGGNEPNCKLCEDSSGNLFGTTTGGGTNGDGTIFKIAAGTHAFSTLASFNGANGSSPFSNLVEDSAGDLIATTLYGGASGNGTVFVIPDGAFTIASTDAARISIRQTYALPIIAAPTLITTTLPNWTVDRPYNQGITVAGGTAPFTFAVTAGSLPPGLSLNSATGAITGTPTTANTDAYSLTITATDAMDVTGSATYAVVIETPPMISMSTLAGGTIGTFYDHTVVVTGGISPDQFTVSSGNLPNGLYLNSGTGLIYGSPNTIYGSPFSFSIEVTDAAGAVTYQNFTITINPLILITTTTLPGWTVNQPYSQTVTISGGTNPDAFTITSGSLPPGLSLNAATGAISGTPTTIVGSPFAFTVKATDANGATASQAFTMAIIVTPTISTQTLPNWTVGQAYSQLVGIIGAVGTVTFSISAGYLPTGLSMNASTGAISGTPTITTNSPFSFTITATDGANDTASHAYSVAIAALPTIATITLSNWTVGEAFNQTIYTTGGTGPLIFAVASGNLPPGLSLNTSTGAISGTPSSASSSTFTISVVDAAGAMASQTYSLTLVNPTLPNWTLGQPYSESLPVPGGSSPYSYAITSGSLPTGLSLVSSTGIITGTPTSASGSPSLFNIQVTEANIVVSSQFYSLTINPALAITTSTLASGTVDQTYTQTVQSTGGTSAITYAVTTGSLPAGLSLNSATGAITGTPTASSGNSSPYITNTLVSFSPSSAGLNNGVTIDNRGNLYFSSGPLGIAAGSHSPTILTSYPMVSVKSGRIVGDSNGNVYYVASNQVLEVPAGTNNSVVLATLSNYSNPTGYLLVDGSGNVFGTCVSGGIWSDGSVFEILAGSDTATTLVSFNGVNYTTAPGALAEDANGNIYGTTPGGAGGTNEGTVFELAAGSHAISTLFTFNGINGETPEGSLVVDGSGNLFGVFRTSGASNDGAVYELAAGSHAFSMVIGFIGTNGSTPIGGLVEDAGGDIFGTTSMGGAYGDGTLFELAASSHAFSTLVTFTGTANGASPKSDLSIDAQGDIYGTTLAGGASNGGTVFEVAASSNVLTTIETTPAVSLGTDPRSSVIEDSSGNLFGICQNTVY